MVAARVCIHDKIGFGAVATCWSVVDNVAMDFGRIRWWVVGRRRAAHVKAEGDIEIVEDGCIALIVRVECYGASRHCVDGGEKKSVEKHRRQHRENWI